MYFKKKVLNILLSKNVKLLNTTKLSKSPSNSKFPKCNNTNTIQKNSSSTLLEEIINNQVRSFIVLNQKYIIDSLVDEVEQKIQEKISPINNEINNIKADFNSLYNEEIKNFKEENVLNDCKENISNISNEYNMLQEKFIKYNNDE